MSSKALIFKVLRKKKNLHSYYKKRTCATYFTHNTNVPFVLQRYFNNLLSELKTSSSIRICGRCIFTGRSRGYIRKFNISRIYVRVLGSSGLIVGLKKASW